MKYVINLRDPHGRKARWMSLFSEFSFEIAYLLGNKNVTADFLSRVEVAEKARMIAYNGLEQDLNRVFQYSSTGSVLGNASKDRRAIKMKA